METKPAPCYWVSLKTAVSSLPAPAVQGQASEGRDSADYQHRICVKIGQTVFMATEVEETICKSLQWTDRSHSATHWVCITGQRRTDSFLWQYFLNMNKTILSEFCYKSDHEVSFYQVFIEKIEMFISNN